MMNKPNASCLTGISIQKKCLSGKSMLKKVILFCLIPLVLSSCATRMRIPEELDPVRLLPEGGLAYLRINPSMVDELILPLIERYGISQATDILERTESLVLAVMPPSTDPDSQSGRPVVYGVASGRFPTRSIALKLGIDRHWTREAPGWVNKDERFRIALTSEGQVVVGTAPLGTLVSAEHDRPNPVPEFWGPAWNNDLAVYIPQPFSLPGNSLPLDSSGLPLESMLISTRKTEDHYDLFLGFAFASERSAMVFAPLCRLFLYALARGLWPQQATGILAAADWSVQGSIVAASGLQLDAVQLSSLLALPFGGTAQALPGQTDSQK